MNIFTEYEAYHYTFKSSRNTVKTKRYKYVLGMLCHTIMWMNALFFNLQYKLHIWPISHPHKSKTLFLFFFPIGIPQDTPKMLP